jgi:hypothetical protein
MISKDITAITVILKIGFATDCFPTGAVKVEINVLRLDEGFAMRRFLDTPSSPPEPYASSVEEGPSPAMMPSAYRLFARDLDDIDSIAKGHCIIEFRRPNFARVQRNSEDDNLAHSVRSAGSAPIDPPGKVGSCSLPLA